MKTEISTFFNYFFKFSYKSKLLEIYQHGLLIVLSPMSRMNDRNGVFGPNDFPKKKFYCVYSQSQIFSRMWKKWNFILFCW